MVGGSSRDEDATGLRQTFNAGSYVDTVTIDVVAIDNDVADVEQRLVRNPRSETAYALLASCYGHLGQSAECRTAWEQALRINPGFSIERRRRVLPFRNPEDFERRVEGLRKAGLTV